MRALPAIGGPTANVVAALIERVADDADEVRVAAIDELALLGPIAHSAVPALREARRDGRQAVREAAEAALKRVQAIGPT